MNKKICFLIGSMAISGGTYVIVQHAAYLNDRGYDVTLAVQEPFTAETLAWHDQTTRLRCIPFHAVMSETFDLVIATWWKTALELHNFNAPRYAYFVQSIESRFYPEEEKPLRELVEETYGFDVAMITEAKWIKSYLKDRFDRDATLAPNGVRKDIYRLTGDCIAARDAKNPRVLIEGPFGVPFKNTALAVRLAKKAGAKEVWVLTSTPVASLPSVDRVFSKVPMFETAKIYRSCDVLVKLSTVEGMFGPPLEIFHCGGTSVVFDVTGHDEYIVNDENSIVVSTGDLNSVVEKISELLIDVSRRQKLIEGAINTASKWPDWSESSAIFCSWVDKCLYGPISDRESLFEKINNAWSKYKDAENIRLNNQPWIVQRHKMRGLFSKLLPRWLVGKIKMLESSCEILCGKNVVR
jgi:glycosyltransferase involved in cell wall biosynthesis